MNSILIFLTGMIIYLIGVIYKQSNDCDKRCKKFISIICNISFVLSMVMIFVAKKLNFSDRNYLISGFIIIVIPISIGFINLNLEKYCSNIKSKNK